MYTIMVVDDSAFIVDVFVTMLERGGTGPSPRTVARNAWTCSRPSGPT